jgi:hypothetical protein
MEGRRLIEEFNNDCNIFVKKTLQEYELHKQDTKNLDTVKQHLKKYPFLKHKYKIPLYYILLEYEEINNKYNTTQIKVITEYLINKIRGTFKHTQSEKTGICILQILLGIKNNRFQVCIAKNTLHANKQWAIRLIKMLKDEYPGTNLSNLILVCSSTKNDLNGNATHCKNVDNVISKMLSGNFKILFVCSNNKRIEDILTILKGYENFTSKKRLLIDIQHDEAHNLEEGIPSKRVLIEHILLNVYINTYMPISASPKTIYDNNNILWIERNIEHNAFDYTQLSNIKSTSLEYSALCNAESVLFEKIKENPLYTDYNITEFNKEYFKKLYLSDYKKGINAIKKEGAEYSWTNEVILEEIEKYWDKAINGKLTLEFCTFMNGEYDTYNIALNLLDNIVDVNDGKIFKIGEKTIHLISTPCRIIYTYSLMKYAIIKDYNPIIIGLYQGKMNLMYKNHNGSIIEEIKCDAPNCDLELNDKIHLIFEDLYKQNVNINVPIIIMGNYKPVGESITFVNYKYGTLRSCTILPSNNQTEEMDYQSLSRLNYMTTIFKKNDPNFVQSPKFMIGYEKNITNALDYELLNDKRIDDLEEKRMNPDNSEQQDGEGEEEVVVRECDNIAVPIKINIQDVDDERIKRLFEIFHKPKRTNHFKEILDIIRSCKEDGLILWDDTTDKFNFDYKLTIVRTYNKPSDEVIKKRQEEGKKPIEYDYRFSKYDASFNIKTPYINEKSKMEKNSCELLVANDNYLCDKFTNYKTQLWLSYKY